ncbi:cell cycle checkpoint control protein RAD9A-like, partial [Mustelus asterias]
MRCLVSGGNISVIGRAVHALSRIGDDCYLEALEEGLALRAVNSSRSAFACFLFDPLFFQKYEHRSRPSAGDKECSGTVVENFRCKIVMKSILAVFKSPASLEKSVEKCKMVQSRDSDRLVIQLLCKH